MPAAAAIPSGRARSSTRAVDGTMVAVTRNIIARWLPAAIVIAAGCAPGSGIAGRLGVAVAAALCVIGLPAVIAVAVTPSMQRPDWRWVASIHATTRPIASGADPAL